jgi:hypothetical protein
MRAIASGLVALALAMPTPTTATRHIEVGLCSGDRMSISVPLSPEETPAPDCCRKACHVTDIRRKKNNSLNCCT